MTSYRCVTSRYRDVAQITLLRPRNAVGHSSSHHASTYALFDPDTDDRYSVRYALPAVHSPVTRSKRKSPGGQPTNDLIFSAHQATNDQVFPLILSLYVEPGSTVADVTYGKGVFWRRVPPDAYKLLPTDIQSGVDCRNLPYESSTLDCVVFDPPYMHTPGGSAHVGHQNYEGYYKNNQATSSKKYYDAVLDLYLTSANEARRVLRPDGVYIVKCQDQICANQQRLTHVDLINELIELGFVAEDLFVVVRLGRPGVSRLIRQVHARKNHSYFLVFIKSRGRGRWKGLDKRFPVGTLRSRDSQAQSDRWSQQVVGFSEE